MFIGVQEPRYGRRLKLLRTKFELPSCQWWCTGIVELNLLAKGSGHGSFFGSVLPTMTSLSTDSRTQGFALKVITNLLQTAQASVRSASIFNTDRYPHSGVTDPLVVTHAKCSMQHAQLSMKLLCIFE